MLDNAYPHSQTSGPNLFTYRDYRQFLKDWYQQAKKSRGSYSYRLFARKAGFKTSNFLLLVMQGKRNLTEESLTKTITGLGLNKQEQEFFRSLVFFNQAKTHQEKDFYYQKLLQSKKFSQLRPIEKQQYDYYSTWYHPVVRELIASKECDGTPEWIAKHLFPSITPAQAAKSIELLEKFEFIQKTENGRWKQASTLLSTGPELSSIIVLNYHKSLLHLTQQILELVAPAERDVSTMTLGILKSRKVELKKKIQEFRREILKMVANDAEPEEVIQLNIQLFPVTSLGGKRNPGEIE